ncbi:hypothetical protein [Paraburkholderia heleia]|uniref:hypothetical protein n=1 Tax=Paraburkholderia heleia TaxID=634127 RepID=UPI002AB6E8E1|nr:hypothetical protein [Paraburkholderia heleia]
MNVAVGQGLQFGKDLIFTFGPLSAVYTHQYYPSTDTMMLVASGIIVVSLFLCCTAVLRSPRQSLLLGLPILISQCYQPDPILLGLPFFILVAILLGDRERHLLYRSTVLIGAAAMSLLPLVKGSTTPAVAVFGAAALVSLARRSRYLAICAVLIFAGTMMSAWMLSAQSIANLPAYFINQMPIISGYANAMSSVAGDFELIGYVVFALLLIAATYSFIDRSRIVITVAAAFYFFLCLKAGFIRGDGHVLEAAFALILFAYFLCLYRPGKTSAGVFAVCLMVWWLTSNGHIDVSPTTMAGRFVGSVRASLHGIGNRLVSGRQEFDENLANTNREIRDEAKLPATSGDADVYSVSLSNLFANDIKWKPRPILQSYSAYTPGLAKINDDHLRDNGPARVFFKMFPIDGRYPSLEDGASWLTLMGYYQPAGIVKDFAYFDRSAIAHPVSLIGPVGPSVLKLGMPYPMLDHESPLFVKIDVQPTLFGKLLALAYKTPQLHLVVTYADGKSVSYRYVPGMGQTGFVFSPTISTATEFLALQSPNWKEYLGARMPVSIGIKGDSGTRFAWKLEAPIQIYHIKMPTYSNVDTMLFPASTKVDSVASFLPAPDCNIDHINDVDPGTQPLKTASNVLHIEGWAMISSKAGTENEGVRVALVYPDGHALVYPANKTDRQDVGAYFHHPDAKMVGYDAVINIKNVDRPASIRILQTYQGKTYISDRTISLE